jgi:hypothetical protein
MQNKQEFSTLIGVSIEIGIQGIHAFYRGGVNVHGSRPANDFHLSWNLD